MENTCTHNKNIRSCYKCCCCTIDDFCSPATRPTMIRNTKGEITSQHSVQLKNWCASTLKSNINGRAASIQHTPLQKCIRASSCLSLSKDFSVNTRKAIQRFNNHSAASLKALTWMRIQEYTDNILENPSNLQTYTITQNLGSGWRTRTTTPAIDIRPYFSHAFIRPPVRLFLSLSLSEKKGLGKRLNPLMTNVLH